MFSYTPENLGAVFWEKKKNKTGKTFWVKDVMDKELD